METKHTTGKWIIDRKSETLTEKTVCTEQMDICTVLCIDIDDEEADANAKLIAAAPDMLIALQKAVEVIERMSDEYSAIANRHASYTVGESKIIEGAIKKATE